MITIDGYPIDAALKESHVYKAEVTSYPVESGATITDNVKPKPLELTMDCVVSDSPLAAVLSARRSKGLADPAFQDLPSVEALDKLVDLMTDRSRGGVVIETALKVYPNMILTQFEPTVDKTTGRALRFTCTFQQITIVVNRRVRIRMATRTGSSKKKQISKPAVVIVNRPTADERDITTLSGRQASWNDEHGRYEYASDEASDGGAPVPARDLGDRTQYDNKITPVPDSGLPDPRDNGPTDKFGNPNNSTYFDPASDEWKNSDGSPVTQKQLDAKRGALPTTGDTASNTPQAIEDRTREEDEIKSKPWFQTKDWAPPTRDGSD